MRQLIINTGADTAALPEFAVVSHDVRDPNQHSSVITRKGTLLDRADLAELARRAAAELHLAVPEPGDVAEDEAAVRIATAVAGAGVHVGQARFGQLTLAAEARGMLRVDARKLQRVNSLEGVLVLTSLPDVPTERLTPLAVVKCAPLFLSAAVLEAVDEIRSSLGAVIEVQPFRPRKVAFLAPSGRVGGNAFVRATSALGHALEWYGSSLTPTLQTETSTSSVAQGFHTALASGADLVLAAGGSGTDPTDVMFEGLRRAGGEVDQIGIPAEPGTACWIGRVGGVAVLGLASCELFGRPGALDLLLPRVMVGEPLDRELLQRIACGGLLLGGPSRVAPFHQNVE